MTRSPALRSTQAWHALAAWLALAAVLMAALAPTVSRLLASPAELAALNAAICSVDAGKAGVKPSPAMPAGHADHDGLCPFCLPHGSSDALLADMAVLTPVPVAPAFFPRLFYHAPRRLFPWAAAKPRGPPPSV